jgi:hypothetical protein
LARVATNDIGAAGELASTFACFACRAVGVGQTFNTRHGRARLLAVGALPLSSTRAGEAAEAVNTSTTISTGASGQ